MSSLERDRSGERRVVQAVPLGPQHGPHPDGKESQDSRRGLEACRSPYDGPRFPCHPQLDKCVWSRLMLTLVLSLTLNKSPKFPRFLQPRTEANEKKSRVWVLCPPFPKFSVLMSSSHVWNPCHVKVIVRPSTCQSLEPVPQSLPRAGRVHRVASEQVVTVCFLPWAQLHFWVVLQKRPGSHMADQASWAMARAPAPALPLAATLPGVPAALEVLEALGALDAAGAGARATDQDRNIERWVREIRQAGRVGQRKTEK